MKQDKLIKTASDLDSFAKISSILFHAASIICLIGAGLVLILGQKILIPGSLSLDLDFIKLYLSDSYQTFTPALKFYITVCLLSVALLCWIVGYGLKLVRQVLAPMKAGRPFEQHVPKTLRKIAWVVIIGGTATQLLGILARVLSTQVFPLEAIFSSAAIARLEISFIFNFDHVILGSVILFLSYIFSYGQALQDESDETL